MKLALGKGLQSLIPKKRSEKKIILKNQNKQESIFNIEIDKIRPNPNQPRREMSEAQLKELAVSIKEYGILQPLLVNKIEKQTDRGRDVEYELIAGERRWRAAQIAKLPSVPVIIKDNSKQVKFEMAIVENLQRENLNPIEKALAYQRLQEEFGLSHAEIAKKVGRNRPTISNTLRILKLPQAIQDKIVSGGFNEKYARAILAVAPEKRMSFSRKILKNNLSIIQVEDMAKKMARKDTHHRPVGPKNLVFRSLENKLELATGYRVSITQRGDVGRVSISFQDRKELDKLSDYLLKF